VTCFCIITANGELYTVRNNTKTSDKSDKNKTVGVKNIYSLKEYTSTQKEIKWTSN